MIQDRIQHFSMDLLPVLLQLCHIDSIVAKTGLPVQKVNELLLMLELHGLVEAVPGQQYRVAAQEAART